MKRKKSHSADDYIGFAKFLWKRFDEEIRVLQVAGSLTYTTLLTLVPLLTVALVLLAIFPIFGDFSDKFMDFINETIVPSGANVVSKYLNDFKDAASQLTTMSIFFMMFTTVSLVQTVDQTFNRIFRVQETRPIWIQYPLYWLLLLGGPLLVGVSMAVMSQLTNILSSISGGWRFIWQLLWDILAMYILYRVLPNRYVPKKHALIGAVFTSVLFEGAKWGFGIYVKNFNSYELIYGAFAAIPVFLVWLQLLWMIILTGALLTGSLSYFRDNAYLRAPNVQSRLYDIVRILLQLDEGRIQGKALDIEDLRKVVSMDYDALDDVLAHLRKYGFISSRKNGWILKRMPNEITVLELMSYFIYRPSNNDEGANMLLASLMEPSLDLMELNLAQFRQKMIERESDMTYLEH